MKRAVLLSLLLATSAAGASDPMVPLEFRGTWVLSAADCSRKEAAKLIIGEASVESAGIYGFVNAVSAAPKSIEVIFKPQDAHATGRNVYTFRISPDGERLLQIRGSNVVATRLKCDVAKA